MQTKTMKTYSIALCLAGFLPGCTNALYFYETEKISLTAEARPDSSQPVQGSLGIKQRVVLIAPKKHDNDDALSAISSFSFNIIPKAGTILNPVLIQTAFITGDAAASLKTPEAASDAALAITLDGVKPPKIGDLALSIVSDIKDNTERNTLKQITAQDFDTLSGQDFENILRITGLEKENYTRALHKALRKTLTN
jgi:hypothetical protein